MMPGRRPWRWWLLLAELIPAASSMQFVSRDALLSAVDAWCINSTEARETFGDISSWNVSAVTNFNLLFNDRFTFNDDISRWDVSRVTECASSRASTLRVRPSRGQTLSCPP